jgi:hypothetical protein
MILDLTVSGVEGSKRRVGEMGERARRTGPLWRRVTSIMAEAEGRKFARGFTRRGHRKVYTLVDSGDLKRSLTRRTDRYAVRDTSRPDELRFGTKVPHATILRARGFTLIDVDRRGRRAVGREVKRYLIGGAR